MNTRITRYGKQQKYKLYFSFAIHLIVLYNARTRVDDGRSWLIQSRKAGGGMSVKISNSHCYNNSSDSITPHLPYPFQEVPEKSNGRNGKRYFNQKTLYVQKAWLSIAKQHECLLFFYSEHCCQHTFHTIVFVGSFVGTPLHLCLKLA